MYANQPSHRQVLFVATLSLSLTLVSVFPQTSYAQGTITMSLHPVSASGTHTIMGNRIILPQGGRRVWFEIHYGQWTPELLKARVFVIDSSSYANHGGTPLRPPVVPCTTDMDCQMALGSGSRCALEGLFPTVTGINTCYAGYHTPGRTDDIPEANGGPFAIVGPATTSLDFYYGAQILFSAKSDPGFDVYGGTLVLDIPERAAGRYIIDILPFSDSRGINLNSEDMNVISTPAVVELPGGCCISNSCQDDILAATCEAMGGTPALPCKRDCNNNGINDACDLATGSGFDDNNDGFIDSCDGTVTATLIPVKASGGHTINGNTIILDNAGQDVWFDAKFGNWGPRLLKTIQLNINPDSFSNGVGGSLEPTAYPCTSDADCEVILGSGAICVQEGDPPNVTGIDVCKTIVHEPGRDDVIPEENGGEFGIGSSVTETLEFSVGNATLADPPKSDPGFEVYRDTIVVRVPNDAAGTYVIQALPFPSSFATDSGDNFLDIIFYPITIELPGSCCLSNACQDGILAATCEAMGGTVVSRCRHDCNNNGINDACDLATGSGFDNNNDGFIDSCDGTVTFSMIPIKASGGHTIDGNTIFLDHGDQDVWFELKYSGWGPRLAKGFQLNIDPSSFSNGVGGSLEPTAYPCTTDADCDILLGPGDICVGPEGPPNVTGIDVCQTIFYTPGRNDDVPEENGGPFGFNGLSTATLEFSVASVTFSDSPKSDPGFEVYVRTFVMHVPQDAAGTYVIQALPFPWSFAQDSNGENLNIIYHPITIQLPGGCCLPDGGCQNGMTASMCMAAGGTPTTRPCTSDCNRNDINDTCEILSGAAEDCNDNNKIDSCEIFNNRALDCNFSFRLDECDLADGTSIDCNANNLPDECDIAQNRMVNDCNQNGVLDSCELQFGVMMVQDCNNNNIIDDCELIMNSGSDCDGNGILDECDLADGTTVDIDGNCVPDVCDPSIAPMAEPNGQLKSRYISFISTNAGCNTAIRVKLVSLYHSDPPVMTKDFTAFEGEYRWIGPPTTYPEDVELAGFIFTGAQLQCTPHFADWSTVGLVHAFGSEVVPDSIYEIQMVDSTCPDLNDPTCYSAILEVRTGRWGDVIEPFAHNSNTQQPTIADILAIVDKHLGTLHPIKARAQMIPNIPMPNFRVSVAADAIAVVDAWLGSSYPYDGPTSCNP